MFCSNCGKSLENQFKFCPYCGERIVNDNSCTYVESPHKKVMDLYLNEFDWISAEELCKKLLLNNPNDLYAQNMYNELKELKKFEIENKSLVKYTGNKTNLKIPYGVERIHSGALKYHSFEELIIPGSVKELERLDGRFNKLVLEEGVESISIYAYHGCKEDCFKVVLPTSLKNLHRLSFYYDYYDSDDNLHFSSLVNIEFILPENCRKEILEQVYKAKGLCQHCGGTIKYPLFGKPTCQKCGIKKDY